MRSPSLSKVLRVAALIVLVSAVTAVSCSSPGLKASDLPGSLRIEPGSATTALGEIRIESYRPSAHGPDDPILIVMHGAGRNADDYRDAWVQAAQTYNVMVIVPEFSEEKFPGYRGYNLGNMQSLLGRDRDRDHWAYSFVQPIFEAVARGTESRRTGFDLFGHSAGGQFVHRLTIFSPETRFDRAVTANSGWYTLPTNDEKFPYGLRSAPGPAPSLTEAFTRDMTIMLGELDNSDDGSGNLRKTAPAMRQGSGRLQRGKHFAAAAATEAAELNTVLAWRVVTVPGVGHQYGEMAAAAAEFLYGEAGGPQE